MQKLMVNRPNFRFNGKLYDKGDPISVDEILSVNPGKLGTLVRTRTVVEPPDRELAGMKKDELIDYAHSLEVTVSSSWTKADIIEAIEGAKHGS